MPSKFISGNETVKYDRQVDVDVLNSVEEIRQQTDLLRGDINSVKEYTNHSLTQIDSKIDNLESKTLDAVSKLHAENSKLADGYTSLVYNWLPIILRFMLSPIGMIINSFLRSYYLQLEYRDTICRNDTPYIRIQSTMNNPLDRKMFKKKHMKFKYDVKACTESKQNIIRNTVMFYMVRFK